ncbi:histone H2A-Bbd type 2/3 [Cynocephalus volans]|uniref:histone H2A-Bbd type 2/3 n=1 Tax=Cynocephalus volans TaxID=110931 RepID=UPI002FCB6028
MAQKRKKEMEEVRKGIADLQIDPNSQKMFRYPLPSTQMATIPTWRQIKKLTQEANKITEQHGHGAYKRRREQERMSEQRHAIFTVIYRKRQKQKGGDEGNVSRKSHGRRRRTLSRSSRAELQFPVSHVDRLLREGGCSKRLSSSAPVFLAAVVEYLTANVLELAGKEAANCRRKRIAPQHVQRALDSNQQLQSLFQHGTEPQVEEMPKRKKK